MFSISMALLTIVSKSWYCTDISIKLIPSTFFGLYFEEHQTLIEIVIEVFL